MKPRLLALSLLFFFFLPLSFSHAAEQNDSQEKSIIYLKPIIVSAKRTESFGLEESYVAENATVITRDEINNLPARNLTEALRYVPGVDIAPGFKFGQASAVTIHGSNARHVLLMVDDIPFNTHLSGQANPTQIPLMNVKQIEVIKGASSSAWGSSLGGVINVLTQDVGDTAVPKISLKETYAEYETTQHDLNLSGKIQDAGYLLSGSFFSADGIGANDDVKESKFFGKIAQPLGEDFNISASFGYSGAKAVDEVIRSHRLYERPYQARYGKLQLGYEPRDDFNCKIAYKYNNQDISTDIYNTLTAQQLSSTVSHHVFHGLSLNADYRFENDDLLVAGADFEWQEIKSNNYLTSSQDISIQAPYMNYTFQQERWELIPGIRFDNADRFGNQWSPSLGYVYHFNSNTLGRAKVARDFNAPPLLWIFNDDPTLLVGPNPDLKAERGILYELGLETEVKKLNAKLNWYWADIKDALNIVFNSDLGVFRAENVRKFRRQGVEGNLRYKLSPEWQIYGNAGFNHSVNRTTRQIVRGNGTARQSFQLGVQYKHDKGFGCHLLGSYNRWDSVPSQEPNDRKPVFDLKVTQDFKRIFHHTDVQFFVHVYNIANSKYWSDISFPDPERYFEGGFVLSF